MRMMALVLFFSAACCLSVSAAPDATNRVFDCGVNTVYLVRRLKGMDADLKEISGLLARDAEKGSSIHDLEVYLNAAGIRTDARRMRLSDLCKKQGALAVLLTHGENGTGHFVAARVLGGGHLQIVDPLLGIRTDGDAPKSKESLPVILIDPPGHAWTWRFFAAASVSLLGVLGLRLFSTQRREGAKETRRLSGMAG
jgi:hypothetical protein